MRRSRTCCSIIAIWSGGIFWPRAVAVALMLVTASSSLLRLISKFFALTMVTSGKSSPGLRAVLAGSGGLVLTGCVAARREKPNKRTNANPRKRDSFFIKLNGELSMDSKFDNFHITDVGVLLDFIHQLLRRDAVEIEHCKGVTAYRITTKAHAGDIHFMFPHESTKITDHTGAIFILEQKHDSGGHDFRRLTKYPDNAGVIRRAKKCAASRDNFKTAVGSLNMQPFVKGDGFVGALFLDAQTKG